MYYYTSTTTTTTTSTYVVAHYVYYIIYLPDCVNQEKVRYKVIGVEMKGMESSMKLVALGSTQRRG